MAYFRYLWVLLIVTGCTSVPYVPDNTPDALAVASSWQLKGKLGVRAVGRSANLSFSWQESPESYVILLNGAMGVDVAEIRCEGDVVTLSLPDGRRYSNKAIELLLAEQLGYQLPVSQLRYWARGVPAPGTESSFLDGGFVQEGWNITVQQYGVLGPRKLLIEKDDIRLKLAALKWAY